MRTKHHRHGFSVPAAGRYPNPRASCLHSHLYPAGRAFAIYATVNASSESTNFVSRALYLLHHVTQYRRDIEDLTQCCVQCPG